jgi:hypothetical protein
MRQDFPATVNWLDSTALKCQQDLRLSFRQFFLLRTFLAKALRDFPLEALSTECAMLVTTRPPVVLEQAMSVLGCKLWRRAIRLRKNRGSLDERLDVGQAWFEVESHTTFNQPVRLVRQRGLPRDMVVTSVEIDCDKRFPEGRAILTGTVFRPPRTYCTIHDYLPGDRLKRLNWADMPPSAQSLRKQSSN